MTATVMIFMFFHCDKHEGHECRSNFYWNSMVPCPSGVFISINIYTVMNSMASLVVNIFVVFYCYCPHCQYNPGDPKVYFFASQQWFTLTRIKKKKKKKRRKRNSGLSWYTSWEKAGITVWCSWDACTV